MTGPAEREFARLGRRYAVVCRTVISVCGGALGLLLVPAPERWRAGLGLLLLITWTCGYGLLLIRTAASWLAVADLAFICAFTVLDNWTVPVASTVDGSGWIFALVSMVAVAYGWHTSTSFGVVASCALVASYLASTHSEVQSGSLGWLSTALWVLAEAALSRGLFMLVRRGGRISDGYLAERERFQQQSALSRARRSDELEYLADLHDTAAATFLMIGAGTVSRREPWLAGQAARDLRVLRLRGGGIEAAPREVVDLSTLLTGLLAETPLPVQHTAWRPIQLPAAAAEAICDSMREALANVQRHAGTDRATVSVSATSRLVTGGSGRVIVEIQDDGCGFDPALVSPHRRGIGESITARMRRAGGLAAIRSAPGRGTTVRLEWPSGGTG